MSNAKPYRGPVSYAPATVRLADSATRRYIEWPEREVVWDFGKAVTNVLEGLSAVSAQFGLSPSRPVFIAFEGHLNPVTVEKLRALERRPDARGRSLFKRHRVLAGTVDVFGWTPHDAPDRPRLSLTESCRCHKWGYHRRSADALYKTAMHEFGHRLQIEGLVDWEFDLQDGDCSSEVQKFAERVSRWSTGGLVNLTDGNWDYVYRRLAERCRQKTGRLLTSKVLTLHGWETVAY